MPVTRLSPADYPYRGCADVTWVRLDENIPHHPKLLSVSPQASWFFVCCLAYCNRFLTNGAIPSAALLHISPTCSRPFLYMNSLVSAQLLEKNSDGWVVHDYLQYQPSAAAIRAQRRATADRVAAHRARRNAAVTPLQPDRNAVTETSCNAPPVRSGPVRTPVEQEKKGKPRGAILSDDAFLAALKANPGYKGIDIDREMGKLDAWLLTPRGRGKLKSQQRIVNWLNGAEPSVNGPDPKPANRRDVNAAWAGKTQAGLVKL